MYLFVLKKILIAFCLASNASFIHYRIEQMNKIFGQNKLTFPVTSTGNEKELTTKIFTYYLEELQTKQFKENYRWQKEIYTNGLVAHYLEQEFLTTELIPKLTLTTKDWQKIKKDYLENPDICKKRWAKVCSQISYEIMDRVLKTISITQLIRKNDEQIAIIILNAMKLF